MDTRNDTRRQWRKRTRRKAVKRWWRTHKTTVLATILVAFGAMLFTLLPTQGQDKEEELTTQDTRYYMSDDYYYTDYEDYQEAVRQRDEYHRLEAGICAAEAEALKEARDAYEEECLRQAENELKFSRAYYQYPEPFNAPPIIWTEDELEGFQEYKIPDEYEEAGGYFPDITQEYLWVICQKKNLDWVTMVALYEAESGYRFDIIGKAGDSGYGQIVPSSNKELLERLEVTDILNPYQNILASCTLMEWLLEEYEGNYAKALTAYNAGMNGAYRYYFSAGQDASPYAKKILAKAERIGKEMQDAAEDR